MQRLAVAYWLVAVLDNHFVTDRLAHLDNYRRYQEWYRRLSQEWPLVLAARLELDSRYLAQQPQDSHQHRR